MADDNKHFLQTIAALVSGLVFGAGLILAGMANPEKVIGFLDITGSWDPSLAFVMGGALIVSVLAFYRARKQGDYAGNIIELPDTTLINKSLVLGSIAFGIGWGLVGICPGPALVLIGSFNKSSVVFVLAMLAGFGIHHTIAGRKSGQS